MSRLVGWLRNFLPKDWQNRYFRGIILSPFEPIPEKPPKIVSKRASAFDPEKPTPLSHRPPEPQDDDWVATPWNGMIPVVALSVCAWGLSEKWMRTWPCPSDGEFGPMRYMYEPEARYWGEYRKNIEPRKGRRHFDWGP